ncbi:hypothetical protein RclHR1_13710004 [Rhizophagus clarus]|uniref:Uncharacterized protein n=1 Tax=Rhizophagus clarus TaxID=94130 RepID=A0A2Z6QFB7_9GLOM|nr:hypothetical protein RclHR1_13710004 [Rhizophagus clarus]
MATNGARQTNKDNLRHAKFSDVILNALDNVEDFDNEIIDISDDDLKDSINDDLENDDSDDNLKDDISCDDLNIGINE